MNYNWHFFYFEHCRNLQSVFKGRHKWRSAVWWRAGSLVPHIRFLSHVMWHLPFPLPRSISHLPPAVYSFSHHSPRHPATPLSSQPLFTSSGSPLPDLHPSYLRRISRGKQSPVWFHQWRVGRGSNGLKEIITEHTDRRGARRGVEALYLMCFSQRSNLVALPGSAKTATKHLLNLFKMCEVCFIYLLNFSLSYHFQHKRKLIYNNNKTCQKHVMSKRSKQITTLWVRS